MYLSEGVMYCLGLCGMCISQRAASYNPVALLEKFLFFTGTRTLITVLKMCPAVASLRFKLISSFLVHLGLQNGLFPNNI